MVHFKATKFGFEYGAAKVFRCHSGDRGEVVITVETPKHPGSEAIQVYVTKTGKVRVFGSDGEWSRPMTGG